MNGSDYERLVHEAGLELLPLWKKNSLRPAPLYMFYLQLIVRKIVETTGSLIEQLLPKSIHAVTAKGFELKAALFCACGFYQLPLIATWANYSLRKGHWMQFSSNMAKKA